MQEDTKEPRTRRSLPKSAEEMKDYISKLELADKIALYKWLEEDVRTELEAVEAQARMMGSAFRGEA